MVAPYVPDICQYQRRKTRVVMVGNVPVGGDHPIRVQSMTTTDTMDTQATIRQACRLAEAGCEIVRITAPSRRAAENLGPIRDGLRRAGVTVPLVADIHFVPEAAMVAAEHVEKVRINPGNYADRKKFLLREYTDRQYREELDRLEEAFTPLVLKLRKNKVALRIGTNHGSLSDRIMNRYGDSPMGMVESALEFVRICEKHDYHDIILSMKSSNPLVMIHAYRLLAARMAAEGMNYPFHLGVTEAGGGEDGRVKSAIGIGALLEDGIGDTVRVSLTEDPVREVPVGFAIGKRYGRKRPASSGALNDDAVPWNLYGYARLKSDKIRVGDFAMGDMEPIRVCQTIDLSGKSPETLAMEVDVLCGTSNAGTPLEILECTGEYDIAQVRAVQRHGHDVALTLRLDVPAEELAPWEPFCAAFSWLPDAALDEAAWRRELRKAAAFCASHGKALLLPIGRDKALSHHVDAHAAIVRTAVLAAEACEESNLEDFALCVETDQPVFLNRRLIIGLRKLGLAPPVVLRYATDENPLEDAMIACSIVMGSLLCDGLGDALHITGTHGNRDLLRCTYNILQGTRLRISRTEFISCPSCGRTLFDLEETTARIKAKTAHLKGVKIAIMGCIVNGPGEMADADFGYVGAGRDKIDLYVGRDPVVRSVPSGLADARLIQLIKDHGMWVDPPVQESDRRA